MRKKRILTKNQFIRLVNKEKESEPTIEQCKKYIKQEGLGADGIGIALTILWIKEDIKHISRRNRRSRKLLIRWLKSEMRWYADLGSYSHFVKEVVKHYFICRKEKLEKEKTTSEIEGGENGKKEE